MNLRSKQQELQRIKEMTVEETQPTRRPFSLNLKRIFLCVVILCVIVAIPILLFDPRRGIENYIQWALVLSLGAIIGGIVGSWWNKAMWGALIGVFLWYLMLSLIPAIQQAGSQKSY